jgi:membrane protein YdbS with pleckstrin-like domain
MYERSSSLVLRWLKVPPEPHPPFGDPASLRVFRAGRNYFNFKFAGWALGQTLALAGIIFWAVTFIQVEESVRIERVKRASQPPAAAAGLVDQFKATAQAAAEAAPPKSGEKPAPTTGPAKPAKRRVRLASDWPSFIFLFTQLALTLPPWAIPVLWALKITGFVVYLVQVPFTYAIMRLDYEMRWYVVTDRSLRIRTGVWKIQELTMSFANLQQVVVTRGPIQGLLKLSDVRVQSAGGGGGHSPSEQRQAASLHTGYFHGVDNANEIRDLILARLKHFREAGLGDPEELRRAAQPHTASQAATPVAGDLLAAARELAAEAKALRVALG